MGSFFVVLFLCSFVCLFVCLLVVSLLIFLDISSQKLEPTGFKIVRG